MSRIGRRRWSQTITIVREPSYHDQHTSIQVEMIWALRERVLYDAYRFNGGKLAAARAGEPGDSVHGE